MPKKWCIYEVPCGDNVPCKGGMKPIVYAKVPKVLKPTGPFDFQYFADEREVKFQDLPGPVFRELIL